MCRTPKIPDAPKVPVPQVLRNPYLDGTRDGGAGSSIRMGRSSLRIPLAGRGSSVTVGKAGAGNNSALNANRPATGYGLTDRNKAQADKDDAADAALMAAEAEAGRVRNIRTMGGSGGRHERETPNAGSTTNPMGTVKRHQESAPKKTPAVSRAESLRIKKASRDQNRGAN